MLSTNRGIWQALIPRWFPVVAIGWAWMMGACTGEIGAVTSSGSSGTSTSACPIPAADPSADQPSDCSMPAEKPCMLYRIQLLGNPSMAPALRAKYVAVFGSACYMSEANTFDCFYKDPQKACTDGFLVPKVYGAAEYEGTYPCVEDTATGNYTRQIGLDPANVMTVYFENAPRETPLIDVNGVPTAINGPYRDVLEPPAVKVGGTFNCASGMFDADGLSVSQRNWILEVNKKAHGNVVHSDLAGFTYPCEDDCGKPMICTEPLVLNGARYKPDEPQVHHEVRRTDLRGCPWGTNSNRNAVVISGRLNRHLLNSYPSATEVLRVNNVSPYTP